MKKTYIAPAVQLYDVDVTEMLALSLSLTTEALHSAVETSKKAVILNTAPTRKAIGNTSGDSPRVTNPSWYVKEAVS